jgi:hypothetical protein
MGKLSPWIYPSGASGGRLVFSDLIRLIPKWIVFTTSGHLAAKSLKIPQKTIGDYNSSPFLLDLWIMAMVYGCLWIMADWIVVKHA